MNRRLVRKWTYWLLPLLLARAFLPVGFMLAAEGGQLHLTLCPAQAPFVQAHAVAAATDHSAHDAGIAGHEHHASGGAHLDPPCPFALGALAAVIEVPQLLGAMLLAAAQIIPEQVRSLPVAGPQRADRIRGPPRFLLKH